MKSIIARSSVIIFIIALLLSLLLHLSGLIQLAFMTYQAAQEYKKTKFLSQDQQLSQKDVFTLFQEPDDIPLPKRTRGVEQGKLNFETFKPVATAPQPVDAQAESSESSGTEPIKEEHALSEQTIEKTIEPEPSIKQETTLHQPQKEIIFEPKPDKTIEHKKIPDKKIRTESNKQTVKNKRGNNATPHEQPDPNQLVKKLIKEHKQKNITPKNLGTGFTPTSVAAAVTQSMLQKGDDVFTIDSNIVGATNEEQMQLLTYVRRMVQQIESMYRFIAPKQRLSHERLYCHITTVIDRNGKIISIELKKTSGKRIFDEFALRGLQEAAPFSPLPKFYKKDTLKQNWNVVG